jgi:hypothetical protein
VDEAGGVEDGPAIVRIVRRAANLSTSQLIKCSGAP